MRITMADDEEEQVFGQNDPSVNSTETIAMSELPGRPYKLTMEVPLFLIMMGVSLSSAAISNILLYRTCLHTLNHTNEECKIFLVPDRSNTTHELEDAVQKYMTFVIMAKQVIESVGPALLSIFLGVWSDTYGRKPMIVWPLFGMALSAICTVVYSLMNELGPWWYVATAIPFSLTGGYTVLFTGAYTYVSDISSKSSVSLRMTLLEVAFAAGSVIGSIASSFLIKAVGNIYLLLMNATVYVMAYAFSNICLDESLAGALRGGLSSVLDFGLAREMIDTCFKRRPNHGRTQIMLVAVANSLSIFILYGISELKYMYTRERLHWALREYTILEATDVLISTLASFSAVIIALKWLKIGDLPLSIVAFTSALAGNVVMMLVVKSWHMYLAAAVSVFKGLSAPLIRSHLSKSLPIEDIAKVFAFICVLESFCPLISPVLYNALYAYTLTTFPGAIYLLSAFINVSCIVMLIFVIFFSLNPTPTYQTL